MSALFQNTLYVVNYINAILYGIELMIYFMLIRQITLIRRRTTMDKFYVVFSTVLLILNTIYWTTQAYFGQQMWIVHSDYPGGMDAFLNEYVAVWYQTWGSAAVMTSNLMSDALMIYRLYVIWGYLYIVIFPVSIWFASLGACIGLLYESGRPNGNYFAGIATEFGTTWNSLTFSFNVIVTTLICGRIIYIGRRCAFSDEGRRAYTGAVAIVIESALPFTIGSMTYVITYGIGSDVAVGFSCYSMFSAISPMLIALRVLTRRAWRKEQVSGFLTTINFSASRSQNTLAQGHHKAEFDIEGRAESSPAFNPAASLQVNLDCTA